MYRYPLERNIQATTQRRTTWRSEFSYSLIHFGNQIFVDANVKYKLICEIGGHRDKLKYYIAEVQKLSRPHVHAYLLRWRPRLDLTYCHLERI